MANPAAFSCADIRAVRAAIRGIADGTPFVPSPVLAGRTLDMAVFRRIMAGQDVRIGGLAVRGRVDGA